MKKGNSDKGKTVGALLLFLAWVVALDGQREDAFYWYGNIVYYKE